MTIVSVHPKPLRTYRQLLFCYVTSKIGCTDCYNELRDIGNGWDFEEWPIDRITNYYRNKRIGWKRPTFDVDKILQELLQLLLDTG